MITWYSFFSAMVFYSIALLSVFVLRHRTGFLKKHGVAAVLFVTVLALVRMALPFDFAFSYALQSWTFLPAVQRYFWACPWAWILLLAVWGIGAVIVLVKDIFSLLCAFAICKNYAVVKDERIQQIAGDLSISCPVVVSPEVPVPYVAGLLRHTIYLPVMDVPDREIELILLHEAQHIRSHDAQIKLLFGLLTAVFWWNPVIWLFRREIDTLLELRCDAKVTEFMSVADRGEYIAMLLSTMRQAVTSQPARLWSAAVNPSSAFQQRFAVLLDHMDAKPRRISIAAKCCLIAAFLASYLVILQPAYAPPLEGEEGIQLQITMEPAAFEELAGDFIVTVDGQYYLIKHKRKVRKLSPDEIALSEYQNMYIIEGYIP